MGEAQGQPEAIVPVSKISDSKPMDSYIPGLNFKENYRERSKSSKRRKDSKESKHSSKESLECKDEKDVDVQDLIPEIESNVKVIEEACQLLQERKMKIDSSPTTSKKLKHSNVETRKKKRSQDTKPAEDDIEKALREIAEMERKGQ